jgi:hypothetical protein
MSSAYQDDRTIPSKQVLQQHIINPTTLGRPPPIPLDIIYLDA